MFTNFALLDFGMPELLIILAIVLLLFGGKKLPQLSKALGESMKNLREGFSEANGAKEDLKKQASGIKQSVAGTTSSATHAEEKIASSYCRLRIEGGATCFSSGRLTARLGPGADPLRYVEASA